MTALRFAPSPTGYLHVGNIRTALFNWLYAQKLEGQFVLRLDDTDLARSKQEYADQIEKDLAWLGLTIDRLERQSERIARYDAVARDLKERGLLYPCYETPDELDRKRARRRARGLPPVYDRSALSLSDEEKAKLDDEGRQPHWRFLLPNYKGDPLDPERTEATFDDLVRGPQTIDLASVSDPVLIRADGSYLYTLPSVIDDIDFAISHVVRGNDHVTNAGVQVALFEALGGAVPIFAHHNLLTLPGGEGLSKRAGSLSVMSLREQGIEAAAIASVATLIGTSEAVRPISDVRDLIDVFDLSTVSQSAATFDPAELANLSAKIVHERVFADVQEQLEALNVGGGADFWDAVRGNLSSVQEAADWWTIAVEDQTFERAFDEDDKAYIDTARTSFPDGAIDQTTWATWTGQLKHQTGRKGKKLFMPLRLALTGRAHGPELALLLPFIGRERILARLA